MGNMGAPLAVNTQLSYVKNKPYGCQNHKGNQWLNVSIFPSRFITFIIYLIFFFSYENNNSIKLAMRPGEKCEERESGREFEMALSQLNLGNLLSSMDLRMIFE